MNTVQAYQHIYTNVEKDQSPHKRGGYQTLFYTTEAFDEAEVEEMEARLLYYPDERGSVQIKRVFFTTSTGKVAVAQIHALTGTDGSGRGGRYLAHSLVFAPNALGRLGMDPFRVFRRFHFITTVAEALAQGNFQTGDIPPVSLNLSEVDDSALEAAKMWPSEALKTLSLFALNAEQLAEDRSTIHLVGETEEIENTLEVAFLAVPTALRSRCTFDAYFYKCNPAAVYYWAVGLPTPPTNPTLIVVDVASRKIRGSAEKPDTAYVRWATAQIDGGALEVLARHRDEAFALCEWLDGRDHDSSLVDAPPAGTVVDSVFRVNTEQVRAQLRQRLNERLPAPLVDRLFASIYQQTQPVELLSVLRRGFELRPLLDALYESYAHERFRPPARDKVRALGELLHRTDRHPLHLFQACWASEHRRLHDLLTNSSDEEYRQFVETALRLRLVAPLSLLIQGQGEVFVDLYLNDVPPQERDWVSLVEALLDAGEVACLAQIARHVSEWPPKVSQRVEKLVRGQDNVPKSFHDALDKALKAIPKPINQWLGWLRIDRKEKGIKRK